MAITWNIDEARATIQAQMDEANRLDAVIDEIASERDAANAEVAHLRRLYTNEHDIAQEQLDRAKAAEAEIERLRSQVVTLEAELAMTSNALRVTQDSVLRNIDRADVAEAEVERLRKALNLIDAARAEAVAKIAALNGTNAPSAHVHR